MALVIGLQQCAPDMVINCKKSFCLRIGPRYDTQCADIISLSGQLIPWATEIRYLGIHIVSSRLFKCSFTMAKRSFYRAANAILAKIEGRATEDVILQLIRSKCLPALLCGLEACPLRKADSNSLDFVVNRLFMKLFKTNNIDTVNYCHTEFQFELPCIVLEKRRRKFLAKYRLM